MYSNLITIQCNKMLSVTKNFILPRRKNLNAIIKLFFHYEHNIITYGSTNKATTGR